MTPTANPVLITGANRGVGFATAQVLANRGFPIILLCRRRTPGEEALRRLPPVPGEDHRLVVADLGSLASVREAAEAIQGVQLTAMINNAAVLPRRRHVSVDGFELQLAVNHLSHFLLAHLLRPAMEAGGGGRILTVASRAHRGPAFDFADPGFDDKPYNRFKAYQQSKLANVLFAQALARRFPAGSGLVSLAAHPGVYPTGLLLQLFGLGSAGRKLAGSAGAAGPIIADLAVGPEGADLNGAYFNKRRRIDPSAEARDEDAQERLWAWSAEAVGLG